MKKAIIIVGIVVLAGLGAWFLLSGNSSPQSSPEQQSAATQNPAPAVVTTPSQQTASSSPSSAAPSEKTFTVTGQNFSFTPSEIRVSKDDKVKIIFKNADGTHDLRIDEFNAATKRIRTGEEDTIEFVADKTGAFEYYCSVGSHRAMGMKGNLIVE